KFGEVVRLEVHSSTPESVRQLLMEEFNEAHPGEGLPLTADDIFEVHGLLDPSDLFGIAAIDLPALKDPPFTPRTSPRLAEGRDSFGAIRDGAILLHHPYDAFRTSVDTASATAAEDPHVS